MWKRSHSFPDYSVSEFGDVRRSAPDKLGRLPVKNLNFRIDRGYKKYRVYKDGKSFQMKASQLVLDAFISTKPFALAEACHNDGDKSNNHYSNLRWDSHKGNHADTLTHGTRSRGQRHGNAKLTSDDVFYIRNRVAFGDRAADLSRELSVARRTVSDVVSGKTWSHLGA